MRAFLLVVLAFCCSSVFAQNYSGTYVTRNASGSLTLKLKQDAQKRVTGTLSGNGNTFNIQGEVQEGSLVGAVSGNGLRLFLLAQLAGNELRVAILEPGADGRPNPNSAQQLLLTRAGSAAPAAKAPAEKAQRAPSSSVAASGNDGQIAQFLMRTPWCTFWFNQTSGASGKERVVFGNDGWVVQQKGGETYSSGYGGVYAGQHNSGNRARWRVRNAMLELSQDGANWAPQRLEVTRNSSGAPIIKADGKEYMQCQ
jgi:hypothetical protein